MRETGAIGSTGTAAEGKPVRAPSLGEQLAASLRDQIIRRRLEPGTHLVEGTLADQYDVSRGPVRDALRRLGSQGLVEARRRGFFVTGLTQRDVDDLYELREAIELLAMERAVEHASPEQLGHARLTVAEMSGAADRAAPAEFAEADMRFHTMLYRFGGNRRLLDVWEDYAPVFASLIQLTVEEDVDLHPSAEDHGRLLDLVEEGDPVRASAELREHLDGARTRMMRAVARLGTG